MLYIFDFELSGPSRYELAHEHTHAVWIIFFGGLPKKKNQPHETLRYGSVFSTAAAENSEIKYSTANKLKASRITQVVLIRSALYDAVPLQRY